MKNHELKSTSTGPIFEKFTISSVKIIAPHTDASQQTKPLITLRNQINKGYGTVMERPVITNLLGHASTLDKHQKLK
jgi:hypothetical protein